SGSLEWRRPSLQTVRRVLHNPIYAGAYAYGQRPVDPRWRPATGGDRPARPWAPMERWKVLLRDHLPAYITWGRYMDNQRRLQQNRSLPDTSGTPRGGVALVAGLLVCGTCGRRMRASYRARHKAHYTCERHLQQGTEQVCYGLNAAVIDDLVAGQVLRALEPASLERGRSPVLRKLGQACS